MYFSILRVVTVKAWCIPKILVAFLQLFLFFTFTNSKEKENFYMSKSWHFHCLGVHLVTKTLIGYNFFKRCPPQDHYRASLKFFYILFFEFKISKDMKRNLHEHSYPMKLFWACLHPWIVKFYFKEFRKTKTWKTITNFVKINKNQCRLL